jgi:hypothetical protein
MARETHCSGLVTTASTADERDLAGVMVCAVDDFEGGDEGEVGVACDETFERFEDQSGMVVEDVSVCHGEWGGSLGQSLERRIDCRGVTG